MHRLRTSLIGVALVLLLGAAALMLGCSSDGDGSSDTGSTKTYTDPDYGFTFDYPSDWQVVSADDADVIVGAAAASTVSVGDPDGASVDGQGVDIMSVRVYELNATIDESLLPAVQSELENLLAGMQTDDPSMVVVEPLTPTDLNGFTAYRFAYTFDWDASTPMRSASYFVFDGATEYQLVVQSAEATWDADEDIFAAFFTSFMPAE